jgi:hypothetical protein
MALSGDQPERQRWRWPQFSILELLLVTAGLAALWKFLALRHELMSGTIIPSFVLLWLLLCWRTARLNKHSFQFRKRSTTDNTGQPQSPPSADQPGG